MPDEILDPNDPAAAARAATEVTRTDVQSDLNRGAVELHRNPYDVVVPETLRERLAYARALSAAGILPRDYASKPANVLVAGEMGRELGLSTVQSVMMLNVVEGRPTLGASGVRAVALRAGHRMRVVDRQHNEHGVPLSVTVKGWRTGDPGDLNDDATETDSRTYTLDMAAKAGLVRIVRNDDGEVTGVRARSQRDNPLPWELHTERMLEARATTWLGDTLFADVTMGLSVDRDPEVAASVLTAEQVETTKAPTGRAQAVLQQVQPTRRTDLPDEYDPDSDLAEAGAEWWTHAGAQVSRRNKQQLAADRIAKYLADHPDDDTVPRPNPGTPEGEGDDPEVSLMCAYPGCVLDEHETGDHMDENGDVLVPEPEHDEPVDPEPADDEPTDAGPVVEDPPADLPTDDGPQLDDVPVEEPPADVATEAVATAAELLAEIDAAGVELERSRQALMVRWIGTHRKNPEDATAEELLPFVEQLRTTMAARKS